MIKKIKYFIAGSMLLVLFLSGCNNSNIDYIEQTDITNPVGKICHYTPIKIWTMGDVWADTNLRASDCSNINGFPEYGKKYIYLVLENFNNKPLSIPCEVAITKYNYHTDEIEERKVLFSKTYELSSLSSDKVNFEVYIDECFTGWEIVCEDPEGTYDC